MQELDQLIKKVVLMNFLKTVKNKNLSPRLKNLKKTILIKSPFQKKQFNLKQLNE